MNKKSKNNKKNASKPIARTSQKSTLEASAVNVHQPIGSPRVTMEDVANEAGVSKITVSRALRDSSLVTQETKLLIQEIAEKMGYRMNMSARNLRLQRSHTIAVVVEMQPAADRPFSDPYPMELLAGICQELTSVDYSVLLTSKQGIHSPSVSAADGVILLGQGIHGDAANELQRTGLPMVVWGALDEHNHYTVVGSDNRQGGASVAERFISLKRKRLLFLGDVSHAEIAQRHAGYLERLGVMASKVETLCPTAFTFSAGVDAMTTYLASSKKGCDAVFAASDHLAMGAVRALTDAGYRVPEDVSVIGYDDTPSAMNFVPPLSSVHQNWHVGGVLLARKVLDLVQGKSVQSEIMPAALVVRAT